MKKKFAPYLERLKIKLAPYLERLKKFLFPGPNAPVKMLILPYATLLVLSLALLTGGIVSWEYSNSSQFCATACHTMIPEATVYLDSPHANVTCEECHIGRASFFSLVPRKAQGIKETFDEIFKLYEYPFHADTLRPARETCETCHQPETFSDDSLRVLQRYQNDPENTINSIYLVMKTGGGAKRNGLGRGIHWHIVNKVEYFATDELEQEIPYVRVYNEDGTVTEFVDSESGFDPTTLSGQYLKTMDCVTCHNRVTHKFAFPSESVDQAMSRGLIDSSIPDIHSKAVEVLSAGYESQDEAFAAIDDLTNYYQATDYYADNSEKVDAAVQAVKDIYSTTAFDEHKVDWNTHPNNLGHINSPGCFRCHDGKHLSYLDETVAVPLECNLCHSIPVVAEKDDFVASIEISRGPEPENHQNPYWINLHNQALDEYCTACHTTDDPGGTSNTSFCSNSACHGNVFTYAGFDAPSLREIIQDQLPAVTQGPQPPEPVDNPTYQNYANLLFVARCSRCHGDLESGGLNLLTYSKALEGGTDGPVILPGDSENSLLIQIQSAGNHFANFTAEELRIIKKWIDAGAPEN